MHKTRVFRPAHGSRWPLIPRRIGVALKQTGGCGRYPDDTFYKWPKRVFVRLFD